MMASALGQHVVVRALILYCGVILFQSLRSQLLVLQQVFHPLRCGMAMTKTTLLEEKLRPTVSLEKDIEKQNCLFGVLLSEIVAQLCFRGSKLQHPFAFQICL